MKKLLLSCAAMCMAVSALATDYTLYSSDATGTWTENSAGDQYTANVTAGGQVFTITYNKSTSSNFVSPTKYTPWRMYNGTDFSIDCETVKMTKVAITMASGNVQTLTVSPEANWNGSLSDLIYTATSEAGANSVNIKNGATKQARISSIVVTGEEVQAASVRTPKIELVTSNDGSQVVMSCETEGAEIYYTEGYGETPADPTKSSTKYTGPIEQWGGTVTYKAIAYVGNDASNVATADITSPYVMDSLSSLIDFNDGSDAPVIMTTPVTMLYQNGDYLWVSDMYHNGMLMYGTNSTKYTNGQKAASFKGTYTVYNGQPEVKSYTFGEISEGTTVAPMEIEVSDISDYYINRYVKLTNVTITDLNGASATISNADGDTAALYNKFTNSSKYDVVTVPEGEGFTIEGFIGKNFENIQLIPVSITGGNVMEQVATPEIDPAGGELVVNAEITITCATDGATIHYTTDGTTPTADSEEYAGVINFTEAMTLKAIAVKEGMLDSDVATAVFGLFDENGPKVYTFDFTDPTKYGIEIPDAGKGSDLCAQGEEKTFTEGCVELTFKNNESTNAPRLWNKSGVYDVRVYAGSEVIFKATGQGNEIQKIEFAQNTGATDWGKSNAYSPDTFDAGSKIWNAGDNDKAAVTFTMTPAAKTFFSKAMVTVTTTSGVEGVTVSDNSEAVYFNLQGVRVANPEHGLYIMVKDGKSSKVMF